MCLFLAVLFQFQFFGAVFASKGYPFKNTLWVGLWSVIVAFPCHTRLIACCIYLLEDVKACCVVVCACDISC